MYFVLSIPTSSEMYHGYTYYNHVHYLFIIKYYDQMRTDYVSTESERSFSTLKN